MAILKIARMGHPVLLRRADAVPDPAHPEIRRLVADMAETMHDAGGVGLAAPQVHVPLRLFVWRSPEGPVGGNAAVLVNPELTPLGTEQELGPEGCLSIPGLRASVPRFRRIRFRGQDIEGRTLEGEAEGFLARILQHENDHLDGILYPSRITDFGSFGFTEELSRFQPPASPATPETSR